MPPRATGRALVRSIERKGRKGFMLKDRTAEELRGRAQVFRIAAHEAEDTCVKLRLVARAREMERLVGLVTPVLSADDARALQ